MEICTEIDAIVDKINLHKGCNKQAARRIEGQENDRFAKTEHTTAKNDLLTGVDRRPYVEYEYRETEYNSDGDCSE